MSTVTKPMMLDETGHLIVEGIARQNLLLSRMVAQQDAATPIATLQEIHRIVQSGEAPNVFAPGDQIFLNYNDGSEQYVLPWDVVHFDNVELADGETVPGMFIQSHYAMEACQFDGNEAFYVAKDAALPAGTYYVTMGTTWGNNVVAGESFSFTLSADLPVGGMLMFGLESSTTAALPDNVWTKWRVWVFDSQTATQPTEKLSLTKAAAGTNLGTLSAATKYGAAGLNQLHRSGYGYNRWSQSGMRQRLNSAAAAGAWWTPQNDFDRAPDQLATLPGFMAGFDEDFLQIIKPVKVRTALNTVTDGDIGTYEDTFDTFFPASLEQEYIVPQLANVEGTAWEYWKQRLGLPTPQITGNTGANAAHIRYGYNARTSAQTCRLRSASRGNGHLVWYVHTSGYAHYYGYATAANRCAPACVIC